MNRVVPTPITCLAMTRPNDSVVWDATKINNSYKNCNKCRLQLFHGLLARKNMTTEYRHNFLSNKTACIFLLRSSVYLGEAAGKNAGTFISNSFFWQVLVIHICFLTPRFAFVHRNKIHLSGKTFCLYR